MCIPLDPPEDKGKENTSENNTNSVSELNTNSSEWDSNTELDNNSWIVIKQTSLKV